MLRTRLILYFRLLLGGCLLGLLLPWLQRPLAFAPAPLSWLLDLASHWQWLFLAGLLLAVAGGSWLDRRWLLALLAAPLPWLSAAPPLPSGSEGPSLAIASANVHLDNHDASALRAWLAKERPELVVLQEVSPEYAQALSGLADYPHRVVSPQHSPFGIALLSRLPIRQSAVPVDDQGVARIEAEVDFAGCAIGVTAVHPMPPLTPQYRLQRDSQLLALLRRGQEQNIPALLAGDLNSSPWSAAFARFAALGWHRASGLQPTWGGPLGIPIDQVLASPQWRLASRSRGPDLGSDHRPVLVRLRLQARGCPGG
ncbi:endonuclease/exonuclease/phosphatase family protein [Pseudomonas sp. R-28-1W-6]|uniref:endonuclease/exonuclease/phosphatase family protein n=1 Tax=Pseudomonas sp. R-28-1W-6 TaxID=2650101 RepID=UPI001366156A|nr:endonuclease/exonuclease/phosphatase family protein [Pseudomonas sp. R-28-1W-6]MWV12494.1 endonuclease/exonuclease/phosphatase family protein [Pseudomonas sp. R-28-1W-6]